MNLARALHEIADYCDSVCTNSANSSTKSTSYTGRPLHASDDVYMPSHVAARLFPPDGYQDGERVVWELTALGGDRRSRDR